MGALLPLILRLAGLGASGLGIGLPAFALFAGLALGAGPAGYAGWRLGHWTGFRAGYAAAGAQAEAIRLARDLAEARVDASNARATAEAARADATRNAAAAARAQERNDGYARELARRGAGGACGLTDRDLRVLRGDGWAVQVRRGRAGAAAGR